jgi:hypothetical protein
MRVSILTILFILVFCLSAESSDIIVLNPVVSEGVEEELVNTYVEIMTRKLRNAGYDVMGVDEREKFFEEIGFTPYLIDDRTLEILKKGGIKWVISGSIIKVKEGYLVTAELWETKKKERTAYSKLCGSDMELLNSIVEILIGIGIEGEFERYTPLRLKPEEKEEKYGVEEGFGEEVTSSKKVSVAGAFLLSIIPGFGAGHFYSHSKTGAIFLIGEGCSILGGIIVTETADDLDVVLTAIGVSTLVFFTLRFTEIVTSIPVAISYNKSVEEKRVQFSPVFMKGGGGIGFEVRF